MLVGSRGFTTPSTSPPYPGTLERIVEISVSLGLSSAFPDLSQITFLAVLRMALRVRSPSLALAVF